MIAALASILHLIHGGIGADHQAVQGLIVFGIIHGDVNASFSGGLAKPAGELIVSIADAQITAGQADITFAVELTSSRPVSEHNSFDVQIRFNSERLVITNVAIGAAVPSEAFPTSWFVPSPGRLHVAGFSMSEATLESEGPLFEVAATLLSPALEGDYVVLDVTLALFGRDGFEVSAESRSGVLRVVNALPQVYALQQNYPNPFNPVTTIAYELPDAARVRLAVYNILGQNVRTLVAAMQNAGYYKMNWDGRNDAGEQVTSGVYIYRLVARDFVQQRKMVLLR